MEFIDINYIKVSQPIGEFYIGSIDWSSLIKIAAADIRKIEDEGQRDDNFDSYLGIQRKISPGRIKEIGAYVSTIDATFPTSIILSISSHYRTIDGQDVNLLDPDFVDENFDKIVEVENIKIEDQKLKIRKDSKVARILDGQHRIEGLRNGFRTLKEKNIEIPKFDFNVTIFVDLDIDDQAQVFSVINKAQTKVNKSLVYDLYDYAKSRSPQKTSHDIVRLLNKMNDSPFYRKIKILGTAENKELETIAQATFVELIMNYISKDPMLDRDILKRKSFFGGKKLEPISDEKEIEKRIFRNLFIKEEEQIILKIIYNYFKVVQNKWPNAWNENIPGSGNILNKSTGLISLMRFLRPAYNSLNKPEKLATIEDFQNIFDRINIEEKELNKDIYVPGSSGQSRLYRDFLEQSELDG